MWHTQLLVEKWSYTMFKALRPPQACGNVSSHLLPPKNVSLPKHGTSIWGFACQRFIVFRSHPQHLCWWSVKYCHNRSQSLPEWSAMVLLEHSLGGAPPQRSCRSQQPADVSHKHLRCSSTTPQILMHLPSKNGIFNGKILGKNYQSSLDHWEIWRFNNM